MGISAGALQWCYGQDSLQPLLTKFRDALGKPIASVFGDDSVDRSLALKGVKAVEYSVSTWQKNNKLTKEAVAKWKAMMAHPEMVKIQLEAASSIGARAQKLCEDWKMDNTQAYCWFFDILVQNGSLRGIKARTSKPSEIEKAISELATPQNKKLWGPKPTLSDQSRVLLQASYDRAAIARQEYRVDVFNRKATIAIGTGYVHGKLYKLTF